MMDAPLPLEQTHPELAEHLRLIANRQHEAVIGFDSNVHRNSYSTRLFGRMIFKKRSPADLERIEKARLKRERKAMR